MRGHSSLRCIRLIGALALALAAAACARTTSAAPLRQVLQQAPPQSPARAKPRCFNPLGRAYRLGGGPASHTKNAAASERWQDKNAVDFVAALGTTVLAIADGTICAPPECAFGKPGAGIGDGGDAAALTLNAAGGQQFYYSELGSLLVKPGQRVSRGDALGAVGAPKGGEAHVHVATKLGSPCDILEACYPADHRGCAP